MDGEGLYREQRERVVAACLAMLGDAHAAEDAAQEVFLRVLPRLGALDGDPRAYLFAVARNVCRDAMARRRARPALAIDSLPEMRDESPAPAQRVADRDELDTALRTLQPIDRELLGCAAAGLSLREMGARTGLAPLAAGQRISRARRRLRLLLERTPALLPPFAGQAMRRALHAAGEVASRLRPLESTLAPLVATLLVAQVAIPATTAPPRQSTQRTTPSDNARDPGTAGAVAARDATPAGVERAAAGTAAHPQASATRPAAADPSPSAPPSWPVTALTPSPSYAQDHTVYATGGTAPGGCTGTHCAVLLRSGDGGHTWQQLAAAGFDGGPILLSPDYPRTATLLAGGHTGLQRSDDGGASFTTVVPGANALAVDATVDHALLTVVNTPQLLLYDIPSGRVAPGPSLPPGMTALTAGTTGGAGGTIVVAAAGSTGDGALFSCGSTACTLLAALPTDANPNGLALSPAFATDTTLLLPTDDGAGMYVSHDGGHTLQRLPVRFDTMMATARLLPSSTAAGPRIEVATMGATWRGAPARILESVDGGSSFSTTAARLDDPAMWLVSLTWLPGGRLLVPLVPSAPGVQSPVACSDDGGTTWRSPC